MSELIDIAEREIRILIDSTKLKLADGSLSMTEIGQLVREFLQAAVVLAEATKDLTASQKKGFVIEAALKLWDEALAKIDLPWVPDAIADPMIRQIIPILVGWAVDALVLFFNRTGWPELPALEE